MNPPIIIVELIAQGGAIVTALIAAVQANRAKNNTDSVSNGFASHVKDSLNYLRDGQVRLEESFKQHLESHAPKSAPQSRRTN